MHPTSNLIFLDTSNTDSQQCTRNIPLSETKEYIFLLLSCLHETCSFPCFKYLYSLFGIEHSYAHGTIKNTINSNSMVHCKREDICDSLVLLYILPNLFGKMSFGIIHFLFQQASNIQRDYVRSGKDCYSSLPSTIMF